VACSMAAGAGRRADRRGKRGRVAVRSRTRSSLGPGRAGSSTGLAVPRAAAGLAVGRTELGSASLRPIVSSGASPAPRGQAPQATRRAWLSPACRASKAADWLPTNRTPPAGRQLTAGCWGGGLLRHLRVLDGGARALREVLSRCPTAGMLPAGGAEGHDASGDHRFGLSRLLPPPGPTSYDGNRRIALLRRHGDRRA